MKDTRNNILVAARELFEKKGFAATTTREIAAQAGVSEVTLFRHFSTKRALFDQTLHSCLHPYTVEEYLKSGVTYDLERDLKHIAFEMRENSRKNGSILRMIMRDKFRNTVPEMKMKKNEHHMRTSLLAYFNAMKSAGTLNAPPEMAMKFFVSNVTHYLVKEIFMANSDENDDNAYFDWMLNQIIRILSNESGKDMI